MEGFDTVFVMGTIHRVLQAEKVLKGEGIAVETQVTPREISADCGMVLLVKRRDEGPSLATLAGRGIPPREVWRTGDAGFERVETDPDLPLERG